MHCIAHSLRNVNSGSWYTPFKEKAFSSIKDGEISSALGTWNTSSLRLGF